ncbi:MULTISPECIES: signal peptidase I [Paenibacillus]|uniref:signal peptidase I n=1 Tax=Paenibacillus TaxID=44249 RepID=UPI0022B91186|nr:signal peptidase I [Paenibacillus caseinilyticus]MCZ8521721.1 signal peptidase I [Paenibacillus caseinilyticus]
MKFRNCILASFILLSTVFTPAARAEEPVRVFVNDFQVIYDQLPILDEGTTLVQFRPSFEELGFKVQWDEASRSVIGTKPNTKIVLQMDNETVYVNGEPTELPVAPRISNGAAFVPIRFLGESTGGEVTWDPKTHHVVIIPTDRSYLVYEEVIHQNLEGAKKLLESGASPNFSSKNDHSSSLGVAVYLSDIPMVKLLLEHGAIPDMIHPLGIEQIDMAIHYKNPEVVKLLIQYGADPLKVDDWGDTLLATVGKDLKKAETPQDREALEEIRTILESESSIPRSDRFVRRYAGGTSMEPTVFDGDRLWIDKQGYETHAVARGDFVLFEPIADRLYYKRIVGLPGETIRIEGEYLFINGTQSKDFMFPGNNSSQEDLTLGAGQYYVIGENYNNSFDSRTGLGLVQDNMILGKIIHVEHVDQNVDQ